MVKRWALALAAQACLAGTTTVHAQDLDGDAKRRLQSIQTQVAEQTRQMEALRQALSQQEATLDAMRRQLQRELSAAQEVVSASAQHAGQAQTPAPQRTNVSDTESPRTSTPAVTAQLFEQPGVLTQPGKIIIEPSLQYSYSSSNRVALVGYTVIPSILVGVVDVREVKRTSVIGALTTRFGLTNRLEIEGKIPFVYRSDTSVGRELLQGTSTSSVFDASGQNLGDVELTARYQLNQGGADQPYYVGSFRFKSRTGKDPFQVMTSKNVMGFSNEGIQNELPTGSGFYGLQPALTMLYPSDPAVLFTSISYLQSIKRNNVSRRTDSGDESLGTIAPGGILGFNFGMGLSLNDKSSFSIGYDHSSVARTRQNGAVAADSVRLQLGTLLLGYSLKLSPDRSLNISLGAGLTRDTPDVTLSLRMPTSF